MPGKYFSNPEEGLPPTAPGRLRAYSDTSWNIDSRRQQQQQEDTATRKSFSMFKRSVLVQGTSLPDKKQQEIKKAFAIFDKDGDGSISYRELGIVMRSLGMNVSGPELDAIIEQVDTDKDGRISFDEFKVMMERQEKVQSFDTEVCCLLAPYYLVQCAKIEGMCCCNKVYERPSKGPSVCTLVDMVNYCCLLNIIFSDKQGEKTGGSGKYLR